MGAKYNYDFLCVLDGPVVGLRIKRVLTVIRTVHVNSFMQEILRLSEIRPKSALSYEGQ